MHPGVAQAWACRAWWCLPCCLLVLAAGCRPSRTVEHVEVTGRVLYNGQPLPGGRVAFVTVVGAFASNGNIDEQGNYKIQAPVGDVTISVDNRMLRGQPLGKSEGMKKGAGRPEQPDPDPVKGTYKQIPSKYYTPDTSGLTYTVTSGPQKHDIELKDSQN
jgi:hypothetical protein